MRTLAGLTVAALLLASCGSDDDLNDADRAFAAAMAPHHTQAIDMAALAEERTDDTELLTLARSIAEAQRAERETLQDWAGDDGHEHDHGDHGDHHGMAGMLTDAQLAELEAATGEEFERLWLELMIEHHEGAVVAAEEVIEDGNSTDVERLALDVVAVQQAEITKMEAMLDD